MSYEKSSTALVESLKASFNDILNITKALGNDKRLQIIISLLLGPKSFEALKDETLLEKTALSNHLTLLLRHGLIEKPEHGKYQTTADGKLFVRAIDMAYLQSGHWKTKQLQTSQEGHFSDLFMDTFFNRRR
jgi:DNA-binding transcriptional ArsR family regulator